MRKYRLLPVVGPVLGIAIGVGIEVLNPFATLTQAGNWLHWVIDLLIVVGFAELARGLFGHYHVETKFLRTLIVGRDRVEGLWMEKLVGYVDFWHRNNYVGMFFETDSNRWFSVVGRRLTGAQVKSLAEDPGSQTVVQVAADCFPGHIPPGASGLSVATA
jgi:hypothetical protein